MFRENEYERLRARLKIDLAGIDDEFADNPTLVTEAGEHAAEAIRQREIAENNVKVAVAEAADVLRRTVHVDVKGKECARSETQISNEVPMDPQVISARQALEDAKYDASMWITMSQGMRERSGALENIARMIAAGFYTRDYFLDKRRDELTAARAERAQNDTRRRVLRTP